MTSERDTEITTFLAQAGWGEARRSHLAGDASFRRYERLHAPDGTPAVLMDADTSKGEDVRPFVRMADWLAGLGLSAPRIMAAEEAAGLLLLEDLGDDLFARVIPGKPELETRLYAGAIDVLSELHDATPPEGLKPYDAQVMTDLAALAFDWYLAGVSGPDPVARAEAMKPLGQALAALTAKPVVILRDYHAENLLWLPDRDGTARIGLLDFQDAMLGHPAYDLVSLLQDARRDVPLELEEAMITRFCAARGLDRAGFLPAYALIGLQRNLRIVGVFARLCLRDGKAHYVDLIPRVWAHLQRDLAAVNLPDLTQALAALPAPDADVLKKLKDQCATLRTP